MKTILKPEWLIDGTGAAALEGQALAFEGEQITYVGPAAGVAAAAGDQVVSLPGATLLPGLINNHVHSVMPGDGSPFPAVQLVSDAGLTLQAVHNLNVSLRSGVTTVRDCGGRLSIMTEVRNAQASGAVSGSRVVACGWPLTITGGHCRYFGGEADGEVGLTQMVRRVVSAGADFVKVMASGGGTPGALSHVPSFNESEMRVIVDAAHALGKPVAAHCIATESIQFAINVGVDYMEHALFIGRDGVLQLDRAIAERLAASQIPVTTTLSVFDDMIPLLPEGANRQHWQVERDRQFDLFRELKKIGVRFLAGSDAGWRFTRFDTFWHELASLVEVGLTPLAALHAGTGAVAEAFGYADQRGSLRSGLQADLLVVRGNPARDIKAVAQVERVYQAGAAVR